MAKSNKMIALEQRVFDGLGNENYSVKDLEDALSQGLDVNATLEDDGHEMNLITACVIANKLDFVKALLPHKPDMNQRVGQLNVKDITPLMAAVIFADYDMAEFLIKAGAKVSPKIMDGRTVLDLVKETGNVGLVTLFEKALEKENVEKRLEEQKKQEAFNVKAQRQKENIQKVLGRKTSKPRRRPTPNGKGA